jgi:hypothetical protein
MLRRTWVPAAVIVCAAAGAELLMGRHAICTCGSVELWVGARDSPKTSQMLSDWYSLSHVVHGFLFYAFLSLLMRRWPVRLRFLAAVMLEASWEVLENTPFVIDRYRATTAAIGYSGDSVLNSMSDICMMVIGFALARKMPVRASLLLVIGLELIPLFAIRDNLTLNLWSLIAPSKALQSWQAGA